MSKQTSLWHLIGQIYCSLHSSPKELDESCLLSDSALSEAIQGTNTGLSKAFMKSPAKQRMYMRSILGELYPFKLEEFAAKNNRELDTVQVIQLGIPTNLLWEMCNKIGAEELERQFRYSFSDLGNRKALNENKIKIIKESSRNIVLNLCKNEIELNETAVKIEPDIANAAVVGFENVKNTIISSRKGLNTAISDLKARAEALVNATASYQNSLRTAADTEREVQRNQIILANRGIDKINAELKDKLEQSTKKRDDYLTLFQSILRSKKEGSEVSDEFLRPIAAHFSLLKIIKEEIDSKDASPVRNFLNDLINEDVYNVIELDRILKELPVNLYDIFIKFVDEDLKKSEKEGIYKTIKPSERTTEIAFVKEQARLILSEKSLIKIIGNNAERLEEEGWFRAIYPTDPREILGQLKFTEKEKQTVNIIAGKVEDIKQDIFKENSPHYLQDLTAAEVSKLEKASSGLGSIKEMPPAVAYFSVTKKTKRSGVFVPYVRPILGVDKITGLYLSTFLEEIIEEYLSLFPKEETLFIYMLKAWIDVNNIKELKYQIIKVIGNYDKWKLKIPETKAASLYIKNKFAKPVLSGPTLLYSNIAPENEVPKQVMLYAESFRGYDSERLEEGWIENILDKIKPYFTREGWRKAWKSIWIDILRKIAPGSVAIIEKGHATSEKRTFSSRGEIQVKIYKFSVRGRDPKSLQDMTEYKINGEHQEDVISVGDVLEIIFLDEVNRRWGLKRYFMVRTPTGNIEQDVNYYYITDDQLLDVAGIGKGDVADSLYTKFGDLLGEGKEFDMIKGLLFEQDKEEKISEAPSAPPEDEEKAPDKPTEYVPTNSKERGEEGGPGDIQLPSGQTLSKEDLRPIVGKFLHQVATQVEQGTGEEAPEEEIPEEEKSSEEETPEEEIKPEEETAPPPSPGEEEKKKQESFHFPSNLFEETEYAKEKAKLRQWMTKKRADINKEYELMSAHVGDSLDDTNYLEREELRKLSAEAERKNATDRSPQNNRKITQWREREELKIKQKYDLDRDRQDRSNDDAYKGLNKAKDIKLNDLQQEYKRRLAALRKKYNVKVEETFAKNNLRRLFGVRRDLYLSGESLTESRKMNRKFLGQLKDIRFGVIPNNFHQILETVRHAPIHPFVHELVESQAVMLKLSRGNLIGAVRSALALPESYRFSPEEIGFAVAQLNNRTTNSDLILNEEEERKIQALAKVADMPGKDDNEEDGEMLDGSEPTGAEKPMMKFPKSDSKEKVPTFPKSDEIQKTDPVKLPNPPAKIGEAAESGEFMETPENDLVIKDMDYQEGDYEDEEYEEEYGNEEGMYDEEEIVVPEEEIIEPEAEEVAVGANMVMAADKIAAMQNDYEVAEESPDGVEITKEQLVNNQEFVEPYIAGSEEAMEVAQDVVPEQPSDVVAQAVSEIPNEIPNSVPSSEEVSAVISPEEIPAETTPVPEPNPELPISSEIPQYPEIESPAVVDVNYEVPENEEEEAYEAILKSVNGKICEVICKGKTKYLSTNRLRLLPKGSDIDSAIRRMRLGESIRSVAKSRLFCMTNSIPLKNIPQANLGKKNAFLTMYLKECTTKVIQIAEEMGGLIDENIISFNAVNLNEQQIRELRILLEQIGGYAHYTYKSPVLSHLVPLCEQLSVPDGAEADSAAASFQDGVKTLEICMKSLVDFQAMAGKIISLMSISDENKGNKTSTKLEKITGMVKDTMKSLKEISQTFSDTHSTFEGEFPQASADKSEAPVDTSTEAPPPPETPEESVPPEETTGETPPEAPPAPEDMPPPPPEDKKKMEAIEDMLSYQGTTRLLNEENISGLARIIRKRFPNLKLKDVDGVISSLRESVNAR